MDPFSLPNLSRLALRPILFSRREQPIGLNDFILVKCLGSGGFSQVFLVRAKFNNKYYALKLMKKKFIIENERESIVENERYIMEVAKNPFLVELHFAFETENHFAFALECNEFSKLDCAGGELFYRLKKVKRMTEQDAKFYFL